MMPQGAEGNLAEVIVAEISIPRAACEDEGVTLALTTPADVRPHIAPRLAGTHKGTYGHVGIVAGSFGRSGAAVMCARGAIRAGAGLVSVATDPEAARLVNAGSIESMTFPIELTASLPEVTEFLKGKSAVLIGPGLRDDSESYSFVVTLVRSIEQPLIIDASALNAIKMAEYYPPLPEAMRRDVLPIVAIFTYRIRTTQSSVFQLLQ